MVCFSHKHCYCKNTKLLMANDHAIDIFCCEDMENVLLYIFSILWGGVFPHNL